MLPVSASKKKVSVIMPCYNSSTYIEKAIESILNQYFSDFEFIIVNDGSKDDTEEKILNFKDDRIVYIRNDVNKGNYASRNKGLRIASGEYIAVMDSDDISLPERLECQYTFLQKNQEIGGVGSFSYMINEEDEHIGIIHRPTSYEDLKIALLTDNHITHPTFFFRRSLVEKKALYYDEFFIYAADYDYVSRISYQAPIVNIDIPLIKYRYHKKQVSRKYKEAQLSYADIIKLRQIEYSGVSFEGNQKLNYLKILKNELLTKEQLTNGIQVLLNLMEIPSNHFDKERLHRHTWNILRNYVDFPSDISDFHQPGLSTP